MISKAFKIIGRVQGVGFRYRTREKALELGLSGYVQNRMDGSVFCLVKGEPDPVRLMENWLHEGPAFAAVDEVITIDAFEDEEFDRFYIR